MSDPEPGPPAPALQSFEDYPLTRIEYMLAIVSGFYSGAIALSIWGLRQRGGLDEVRGLEPQAEQWKS